MNIVTDADIQGDYYGRWKKKKGDDEELEFVPLGKAIYLENAVECLEDHSVDFWLRYKYFGRDKTLAVTREIIGDKKKLLALSEKGMDVSENTVKVVLDVLRMQERELESDGKIRKIYRRLGWIENPAYNPLDPNREPLWVFRAHQLIGSSVQAKYEGSYEIEPSGTFDGWKRMVCTEILGRPALEFLMIAGLSAVVNGLIAPLTTGECPIVHLFGESASGKTSASFAAVSAFGAPFHGETITRKKDGTLIKKQSLLSSWGSTENAATLNMEGNRGFLICLDELGKFAGNESALTQITYHLSEGTDKTRLNRDMKVQIAETYLTTIISVGEYSLAASCKDKTQGITNRILEINEPLTDDAEHARRLKESSRANNGWAAPMLAEYIIHHGGENFVLNLYKAYCDSLGAVLPDVPFIERRIEKFFALIMTTAYLARSALGINFDLDGLAQFMREQETMAEKEHDVTAESFKAIVESCETNRIHFYSKSNVPLGEVWGRWDETGYSLPNGAYVCEEISIYKNILEKLLKNLSYPSRTVCVKKWISKGWMDHETGRHTRSRIIIPGRKASDVYVLRIFGSAQSSAAAALVNEEPLPEPDFEMIGEKAKANTLAECEKALLPAFKEVGSDDLTLEEQETIFAECMPPSSSCSEEDMEAVFALTDEDAPPEAFDYINLPAFTEGEEGEDSL